MTAELDERIANQIADLQDKNERLKALVKTFLKSTLQVFTSVEPPHIAMVTVTVAQLYQIEDLFSASNFAIHIATDMGERPEHCGASLRLVAKQGGRGDDWAVYMGLPFPSKQWQVAKLMGRDLSEPDHILRYGIKSSKALGEFLFEDFAAKYEWRQ